MQHRFSGRAIRFALFICALLTLCVITVAAQDEPPLLLSNTRIIQEADGFGGQRPVLRGDIYNYGAEAYRNIIISVEALGGDGAVIGEGLGYLVDACGTALLDYPLPPESMQSFSAPLELFAEADIHTVDARITATSHPPEAAPIIDAPLVHHIARGEAVMLEWRDNDTLLYGLGCAGDVFTELDWWRYTVPDQAPSPTEHPGAASVTPAMIERSGAAMITQSGAQNPALYYSSHMRFPPRARRVLYQNDLHTIFSVEPDGSFKRIIHDGLHRHSLRGFLWARNPGIFLAYYFGAYGEPVYYFSGDVQGKMLMGSLDELPASRIVPGPSPDGLSAVVGWTQDVEGYYLQRAYGPARLLLAAALPGSNYPAPIVSPSAIYLVRDIDAQPSLQCYNRATENLTTLTDLPLRLSRGTRAWTALSPDGTKLALAANGTDGGLWWIALSGDCG